MNRPHLLINNKQMCESVIQCSAGGATHASYYWNTLLTFALPVLLQCKGNHPEMVLTDISRCLSVCSSITGSPEETQGHAVDVAAGWLLQWAVKQQQQWQSRETKSDVTEWMDCQAVYVLQRADYWTLHVVFRLALCLLDDHTSDVV